MGNLPTYLSRRAFLVALVCLFAAGIASGRALEPGKDGLFLTGKGVRVKKILFVDVEVYAISHHMRELPVQKSRRAVIDADTDKRFVWRMLRDVESEKVRETLKEAYERNGYTDQLRLSRALEAFLGDLKEGTVVTIAYRKDAKTTTINVGGKTTKIDGENFMRATWGVWFGKMPDQPRLGDELISNLQRRGE